MADKLTTAEFAAKIKQRDARLASVPDEELVRKVLDRRPDLIIHLAAPPSMPAPPSKLTEPNSFPTRVLDRVGEAAEGTEQMIPTLLNRSRELYKQGEQRGGAQGILDRLTAIPKAEWEALSGVGKGIYGVTTPGLVQRIAAKEDPANIAADAALMMLPSGETPVRGTLEAGAKAAAKGFETPTRVTLQRLSGAGKEPVLLEGIKRKATETERAASYEKAKAEVEKSNQERLQEHAQEVEKAQAKYRQELAEYDRSAADKKAEHSNKVLKARKEWVEKAHAAKVAEQEAAKISARRETLTRTQEEYGKRLQQNMKETFQTVKGRLDSRWDRLRKTPIKRGESLTILNDERLNSKAIADTVSEAEKKYLQGAPDSITQFRNLMNWMREDTGGASASMVDEVGGATPALRPITWDEARTHYTALGDRMFSGDLPGNVSQAIRYVRENGLGKELRAGATRANALPAYESLLGDWSRFESDWKDTSSVALGGGSPLARALKAPNAATLIPQVTGKTGDLLMERLGKYRDAGASPTMASAIRKLGTEVKNLPTIRVPKAPGPLELPAEPKIGEPPELSTPKPPKLKTAKKPEPVPPIDPVAIRRGKMLQYTGRPKSLYDFLPPRVITEPLLSVDAIREWVARQPRKELPVP